MTRPNLLLVLPDGMQGRTTFPESPCRTPNIDRIAERGRRFRRAYTVQPTCSPARASLMTAAMPHSHGVLQVEHCVDQDQCVLRTDYPHWAQRLAEAGYRTAYFGKWHIGMTSGKRKKPSPTEHGFDYWFGLSNGAHPSHKDPVNFLRNGKRVGPLKGYSCQLIVDDAIRWLEQKVYTSASNSILFLKNFAAK